MGKLEYSRVAKEKEIEDWMASEEIDERPTKHPSTQSEQHQASWYQNHVVNHRCCTRLSGLKFGSIKRNTSEITLYKNNVTQKRTW